MKTVVLYIMFYVSVLFGLVCCFSGKMLDGEFNFTIEDELLDNSEKAIEVRSNMMDEILKYIEENEEIKIFVKRGMKKNIVEESDKEKRLNSYFDALDEMNISTKETTAIEKKIDEVEEKYRGEFPKGIEQVFEDGKAPTGMSEDKENIVIGGDIIFEKNAPENAVMIANLIRESKSLPLLKNRVIAKKGFYCSQASFMWSNSKWQDGKVKYRFTSSTSTKEEEVIEGCMKKWSEASGGELQFIRYKNNRWNKFRWNYCISKHVQITTEKGIGNSWSTLGAQIKAQIHIDYQFFEKNRDETFLFDREVIESEILHELGHTLTLFHEHQRPDRDKYVNVDYERAASVNNWTLQKAKSQYGKVTLYVEEISKEYDYDSIMHYWSSMADSKGKRDIEKKTGEVIGRVMSLSECDKQFITELYRKK